jgi:hypothetical protein
MSFELYIINYEDFVEEDTTFSPPIKYKTIRINSVDYKIVKPSLYKTDKVKCIYFKDSQIVFSIRRFYKIHTRTHVIIYSSNGKTNVLKRHEYYTSNSDLSFYRYCITKDSIYYKGLNYISSTFINIDLQKFINGQSIYHDLESEKHSIQCQSISDIMISDPTLSNRIESPESTSSNDFFKIMSDVFPHVDTIRNYKATLLLIIKALYKYTIASDFYKITLLSDIYCLLKEENLNHEIFEGDSRTEFFTKLKTTFETLFKKYFSLFESTKLSDNIFIKDVIIGSETIKIFLFKNIFKYNDTDRKYIIYWILYEFSGKVYRNIVHILPENSKITEYGLDDRYVNAGIFINKSFDYKVQAPISLTKDGPAGRVERSSEYIFIGKFNNYNFLTYD